MVGGITGGSVMNYANNFNLPSVSGVSPVNKISGNELNSEGVKRTESGECQTCSERRYVDGSDEGNVSFKAPGHIAPEASAAVVSAHEQEHVANARAEGAKENAELISASVRLQTAVCPECGTAYVAGGVTTTTIKYEESSPYEQGKKLIEGSLLKGRNVDLVA